jgi:large subunit ribosomal protein L24
VRIHKGDIVEIITGNDVGKRGRVLSLQVKAGRAIVEGVNSVYKHMRPSKNDPQGGRIQREAAVHISNMLPVCNKCNRGVRVNFKDIDGNKTRVCAKCNQNLRSE